MPKLTIDIEGRLAKFQDSLDQVAKDGERAAKRLESAFGAAKVAAAGLVAAFAAVDIAQQFRGLIDVADELGDVGSAFGLATEQVAAFRGVAKVVGLETADLVTIFTKFSQRLREAGGGDAQAIEDLKVLGVTIDDIKKKDFDGVLRQALAGLNRLQGGADKVAILRENFGKTGFAMDEFAGKIERLTPEVQNLGAKFSGDLSENADKFKEQLSLLAINGEALKVTILTGLLPALNRLTEEFLNAKREGTGFLDGITRVIRRFALGGGDLEVAQESLRNFAQQLGQVDRQIANAGTEERRTWFENQRKKLLADIESQKAIIKILTDPGVITGAAAKDDSKIETPKRVDAAKVAAEAAKRAAEEKALEAERQRLREAGSAAQVKFIEEQFAREKQLQDDEIKNYEERAQAEEEIRTKIREGWVAYAQAIVDADEKMTQAIADADMNAKETNDVAKELGLTFSSAFEDAIVKGESFRDVLKGISQDVARIILRKSITEPLGDSVTKAVKDSGIGSSIGGFFKNLFGFAEGGSFTVGGGGGTDSQLVAFKATPGERVTVETPAQQGSGGFTVINQYVNPAAEIRQQIAAATPTIVSAAVAQMTDMRRRGAAV